MANLILASTDDQLEADLRGLVRESEIEYCRYVARRLREDLSMGDHLGQLERRLRLGKDTISVSRPSVRSLHLVEDVPKTRLRRLALELMSDVEEHSGLGIWVSNPDGEWAFTAWNKPHLIRVTPYPNDRLHWRCHALRPMISPSSIAGEEFRGQKVELGKSLRAEEAAAILRGIGITDPRPPAND